MKTIRDLERLEPNFRKKVEAFLKEVGNEIFITETFRSESRQKYLYSLGRTRKGKIVTWTLNSKHTQGLAIDIAFKGKMLYPNNHKRWQNISKVAKKYGMSWGYDLWKKDRAHFQCDGSKFRKIGEYENLFLSGEAQGRSKILGDVEGWIRKTGIKRELAFSILIMFERIKKDT